MGDLKRAVRLLTVVPLPDWWPEPTDPAGRATVWFPVVGLLLGTILASLLMLPVPDVLAAAVAVLASAVLTGGLHEDGLMDSADAVFLRADRDRRMDVLQDPRVGSFGVTAAVAVLLVRFALFAVVAPVGAVVAPVVGRWSMSVTLARGPALRPEGLGASYANGARPVGASVAAVSILSLAALVGLAAPGSGDPWLGVSMALAAAAGGAASWACRRFLVQRLGGLNGDGHGATGYLAETAALLAFVPVG